MPAEVHGGDLREQAQGKCSEMDSPHSETGGTQGGVMDLGEAKRSPNSQGQCLSNTIWGKVPESRNPPRDQASCSDVGWGGHWASCGQDRVALRLFTDPTLTALAVEGSSARPSLGLNSLAMAGLGSRLWGFDWQAGPMDWIGSETLTRPGLG